METDKAGTSDTFSFDASDVQDISIHSRVAFCAAHHMR